MSVQQKACPVCGRAMRPELAKPMVVRCGVVRDAGGELHPSEYIGGPERKAGEVRLAGVQRDGEPDHFCGRASCFRKLQARAASAQQEWLPEGARLVRHRVQRKWQRATARSPMEG